VRWDSDNPLARAIARLPLPIRAKQLFGSLAVAALLALVAVLGLLALGQSNSRGTELRSLQQKAVYEQLLLTDATQLKEAIDKGLRPVDVPSLGPRTRRWIYWAYDETIGDEANRLCLDAGFPPVPPQGPPAGGQCVQGGTTPHLPFTLHTVAPALSRTLATFGGPVTDAFGVSPVPLLFFHDDSAVDVTHSLVGRAYRWMSAFVTKLAALTRKTQDRATALVATDRRSYGDSRDLLIGAGAGSVLLALALALLLSDSLLVPLRKMQRRLAAIAAGDFSGRLEVPNRDEIGVVAADVNRMSDELQRVYRELELVSERKSRYVTNMSHELRTPLNAIIGFSEVLHEQMFGELNERQLAYVNDVLEAGKHLLALINELLDLAKIEAGRMELQLSQVAVPALLQSAVSLHDERAARAGVALRLKSDPKEMTVTADERRILQVVVNLVANAIKFTPQEGRVDVSAQLDDGTVEIAVADTGPGIASGDLETIFEEFEQSSDGKKVEGTGLGLPLSRKLVELHGGRLWVESVVGSGSTFRFTLPVRQEAPTAAPPDRSPAPVL
jgi:signal transduction histidine kinase